MSKLDANECGPEKARREREGEDHNPDEMKRLLLQAGKERGKEEENKEGLCPSEVRKKPWTLETVTLRHEKKMLLLFSREIEEKGAKKILALLSRWLGIHFAGFRQINS